MYGFTGYGTNEYGTSRKTTGIVGPLVDLAMSVLRNTYGVGNALALNFRATVLKSVYGVRSVLMLNFRNTTLTDSSSNITNTLEL